MSNDWMKGNEAMQIIVKLLIKHMNEDISIKDTKNILNFLRTKKAIKGVYERVLQKSIELREKEVKHMLFEEEWNLLYGEPVIDEKTIWSSKQNHPELVVQDCKEEFNLTDKQCERLRFILMNRDINK